ncbi:hypothetical protein F2A31_10785 [Acinetobacter suaedae]|uniref:Uncharacterized protein n=1 Tax=Acinetobacter suaedae TaxID=2609668 RepID=A0A5P1UVI9_9GAMM|nr:hypothetical protein [Acinetobacter sp. C16S1]QER40172.1 hypothetical protein F2A31_10785 [Acinetobacter sp. C16S1]
MLDIECVFDENTDLSGLDLGHLRITNDGKEIINSIDLGNSGEMMIFLSLPLLLYGLESLLRGKSKEFEFIGVDSSKFIIEFKIDEKRYIKVFYQKEMVFCGEIKRVVSEFYFACKSTWDKYSRILPEDDMCRDDIELYLTRLYSVLKSS